MDKHSKPSWIVCYFAGGFVAQSHAQRSFLILKLTSCQFFANIKKIFCICDHFNRRNWLWYQIPYIYIYIYISIYLLIVLMKTSSLLYYTPKFMLMRDDAAWCLMMHDVANMMMHGDAWWCMMMHEDAWWSMITHGDAWWCMTMGLDWFPSTLWAMMQMFLNAHEQFMVHDVT